VRRTMRCDCPSLFAPCCPLRLHAPVCGLTRPATHLLPPPTSSPHLSAGVYAASTSFPTGESPRGAALLAACCCLLLPAAACCCCCRRCLLLHAVAPPLLPLPLLIPPYSHICVFTYSHPRRRTSPATAAPDFAWWESPPGDLPVGVYTIDIAVCDGDCLHSKPAILAETTASFSVHQ
jgi:hypothetical protein